MKPNVLIFTSSFEQGGSERQAVQLARLLDKSGRYRVHMACLNDQGVLRREVQSLHVQPIQTFPLTSFYNRNMLTQLWRCAQFMRAQKIDIVQTHDFYTNVFGITAATLAQVPVRIAARRETAGTKTERQLWVERRAYSLAHAVVANSDAVRQELLASGIPERKVVTIYNGMDIGRIETHPKLSRPEALRLFGLLQNDSRRYVTIIANMRHPLKDQRTFLRAARLVRAAVPTAAFVLAGEGDLLNETSAYANELGLQNDAFFIGHCSQVSELLNLSEVGVLSSAGVEGFSNSIIEYMAAALPVVVTDIGGAREAVVDAQTGFIVPPGDETTMAERIITLLQNPQQALKMGQLGRDIVERKFSCEAQLMQTEQLYRRLLGGRLRRSDEEMQVAGTEA